VDQELRIELHSRACSCRGGSWVIAGGAAASPCSNPAQDAGRLVVTLTEWRALGKPATAEEFGAASARAAAGERREFQRFEAALPVRLSRIRTWKNEAPQTEETKTEVIAKGGALVSSAMAVEKGDLLLFELAPAYKTRAEVIYASFVPTSGGGSLQRLGLRFIDAPLPDEMIPPDAQPLE
jgi:hypothetical protein